MASEADRGINAVTEAADEIQSCVRGLEHHVEVAHSMSGVFVRGRHAEVSEILLFLPFRRHGRNVLKLSALRIWMITITRTTTGH